MLLGAFGLLLLSSCSPQQSGQELPLVEEEKLLSTLQVADPAAAEQLLKGWHQVEHDSWRWTQKGFSAALKTPGGDKAATLELKFVLPEPVLARLHSVTMSASVGGTDLEPETYSQPGEQVYRRSVPVMALRGNRVRINLVRVDFHLDKAVPPDANDRRELGVVVQSVSLE